MCVKSLVIYIDFFWEQILKVIEKMVLYYFFYVEFRVFLMQRGRNDVFAMALT